MTSQLAKEEDRKWKRGEQATTLFHVHNPTLSKTHTVSKQSNKTHYSCHLLHKHTKAQVCIAT